MRLISIVALAFMALTATPQAIAQTDDTDTLELKTTGPAYDPADYTETFPTEVEVTALLWRQLKINALEEQTEALRVEFERSKDVKFSRQESLANVGQQQPEHIPALMATFLKY